MWIVSLEPARSEKSNSGTGGNRMAFRFAHLRVRRVSEIRGWRVRMDRRDKTHGRTPLRIALHSHPKTPIADDPLPDRDHFVTGGDLFGRGKNILEWRCQIFPYCRR